MRQYILINTDLNMSSGKLAGQAAHASTGLIIKTGKVNFSKIQDWFSFHSQRKIVCGMKQQELLDTIERLKQESISHYVVYDTGKTEIPADSLTAVAIFPFSQTETPRWFKKFRLL